MVNPPLLSFILLVALIHPVPSLGASPVFAISVEASRVEYGKALYVELGSRELQPVLHTLDLSPLERDFIVDTPDSLATLHNNQQRWRIRLYPRRLGELWIPPLTFRDNTSEAIKLTVTPAIDPVDKTPISVRFDVGATRVWLNQAVAVTLRLETTGEHVRLATEMTQQDSMEIMTHPTHTSAHTEAVTTGYELGWTLYPRTSGKHSLQLPPVKYYRDGGFSHRFYPPRIELEVQPLPAYIPPTLPIGQIRAEIIPPDRLFLLKNALSFLTLRIYSDAPPGQYSASILRQLKSNRQLTFYPPADMTDTEVETEPNEVLYQIPLTAKTLGWIPLPAMRLQYFDTATGKIQTYTQSPGRLLVINQWLLYGLVVSLLLGGMILLRHIHRRLKLGLRIYDAYRTALHRFLHADTPVALKSGLMDIATAEFGTDNLSLTAWLECWTRHYPHLSWVAQDIQGLQARLYGQATGSLDEIRPGLVNICYHRMPLLKLWPR